MDFQLNDSLRKLCSKVSVSIKCCRYFERLSFTFTSNGKSKFVQSDQLSPLLAVNLGKLK